MKAVKFNSQAQADAFEKLLRRAHGIPEDDSGVPSVPAGGGGAFADNARTIRYADIRKHPTLNEWAVIVDDDDPERLTSGEAEQRLTVDPEPRKKPPRMTRAAFDTMRARLLEATQLGDDWRPPIVR